MIRSRLRHRHKFEAELDITSFMNLMIILVPVLLMSMVFARITVLDLTLPKAADGQAQTESEQQPKQLDVVIRDDYLDINYPAGVRLRRIEATESGEHNYQQLSELLQNVKIELSNQGIDKQDIVILSEPDTDYQTLVRVMDRVRSFKAVVAASVVDAELFPSIALGDAPPEEAQ